MLNSIRTMLLVELTPTQQSLLSYSNRILQSLLTPQINTVWLISSPGFRKHFPDISYCESGLQITPF